MESVSSANIANIHWRRSAGPQAGRAEVRDDAHSQPGDGRLCSGGGRAAWMMGRLGMNSRQRISMQKKSSAELTLFCPASTRIPQRKTNLPLKLSRVETFSSQISSKKALKSVRKLGNEVWIRLIPNLPLSHLQFITEMAAVLPRENF